MLNSREQLKRNLWWHHAESLYVNSCNAAPFPREPKTWNQIARNSYTPKVQEISAFGFMTNNPTQNGTWVLILTFPGLSSQPTWELKSCKAPVFITLSPSLQMCCSEWNGTCDTWGQLLHMRNLSSLYLAERNKKKKKDLRPHKIIK